MFSYNSLCSLRKLALLMKGIIHIITWSPPALFGDFNAVLEIHKALHADQTTAGKECDDKFLPASTYQLLIRQKPQAIRYH